MQNNITPFAFGDNMVRVHLDETGNLWFVAKDVCRVLEISDHHQAIASLNSDEAGRCIIPTSFGEKEAKTISESGLYALIFRSRKPEAQRFRKWVTSEVLPALRKTGRYALPGGSETKRSAILLSMGELPEDVQAMRPKLRDRCLSYALQAARVTGIMDMETVNELFISYCRILYTGSGSKALAWQTPLDIENKLIHEFIAECLTRAKGKNLRYTNIKMSFLRWCERRKIGEIPSDRNLGGILKRYFPYFRSNGTLYEGVEFTEQGLA